MFLAGVETDFLLRLLSLNVTNSRLSIHPMRKIVLPLALSGSFGESCSLHPARSSLLTSSPILTMLTACYRLAVRTQLYERIEE